MVANVILANTFLNSSNNVENTNATNSAKNYYTGTAECLTKEDFFQNCIHNGDKTADTLEGYKKLRQEKSDTTGLSEEDYENEFQDYIKYRGCKSSAELRELDSVKGTFYATKNDLINFVKNSVASIDDYLKDCNCPSISSTKEWDSILQNSDTGDLVTLAKNFPKKEEDKISFGQQVTGLVTFLYKSLKNNNLNFDIKKYLLSYLNQINSKWKDITNYSVYLTKKEKEEEEAAKKAKEISMQKDVSKNTAFKTSKPLQNSTLSDNDKSNSTNSETTENFKKYKETLISQYKN